MPSCKHCGSLNVIKRGYNSQKDKVKIKCKSCGKYSKVHKDEIKPKSSKIAAKILLFDIETNLMEVYVFDLKHNDYIPPRAIKKDFSVLTWSAKWLFEPEILGARVTGEQSINREDVEILTPMWHLLDEANIVIVQNGKKFDIPKLNARFLKAGFPPPMYYQVIDTKEIMSKNLALPSNSLEYANKFFGLSLKGDDMVFEDWIECGEGNEETIQKMFDYNQNDVVVMEELYLKLRPWIPAHANLGIYADTDRDCCPNCQSTELSWTGEYATPLGLYEAFRCGSCGAIGRSTQKNYKINSVRVRN